MIGDIISSSGGGSCCGSSSIGGGIIGNSSGGGDSSSSDSSSSSSNEDVFIEWMAEPCARFNVPPVCMTTVYGSTAYCYGSSKILNSTS